MKTLLSLGVVLLIALACACACSGKTKPGEEALVVGTVIDAATGQAVPDIRLEGPGGAHATSDERGRFEMDGLHVGDAGEITAKAPDGRRGGVTLRPLQAGRIEVVVQLYRR